MFSQAMSEKSLRVETCWEAQNSPAPSCNAAVQHYIQEPRSGRSEPRTKGAPL
jgi:hypothetical protein